MYNTDLLGMKCDFTGTNFQTDKVSSHFFVWSSTTNLSKHVYKSWEKLSNSYSVKIKYFMRFCGICAATNFQTDKVSSQLLVWSSITNLSKHVYKSWDKSSNLYSVKLTISCNFAGFPGNQFPDGQSFITITCMIINNQLK